MSSISWTSRGSLELKSGSWWKARSLVSWLLFQRSHSSVVSMLWDGRQGSNWDIARSFPMLQVSSLAWYLVLSLQLHWRSVISSTRGKEVSPSTEYVKLRPSPKYQPPKSILSTTPVRVPYIKDFPGLRSIFGPLAVQQTQNQRLLHFDSLPSECFLASSLCE